MSVANQLMLASGCSMVNVKLTIVDFGGSLPFAGALNISMVTVTSTNQRCRCYILGLWVM